MHISLHVQGAAAFASIINKSTPRKSLRAGRVRQAPFSKDKTKTNRAAFLQKCIMSRVDGRTVAAAAAAALLIS